MRPRTLLMLLACFMVSVASDSDHELVQRGHFAVADDGGSGEAKAVQLIGRAEDGSLTVVEEGLQALANLAGSFQVIGVVGNFHTGKSFLMNQIMNRMSGFETGPTVNPTTEGVWFWGQPLLDHDTGMRVLLLDSEGLSAPGNSADYDARVFAVVTMLSSHLLYNSVKIIDESAMEYLQVLARRAQLFGLKTSLNAKELDLEASIRFPALTWVVQDFFQRQVDNESPTQWLHRLMRQQSEGKADTYEGLDKIFTEAHCKTIFLPATGRDQLQNLEDMDPTDLTSEYVDDKAELISHLIASLRRQQTASVDQLTEGETGTKGEETQQTGARTGREIAVTIKVLVRAANSGQMSKIPSMWDLFMKDQVREAREQSARVFQQSLDAHRHLDPPHVMATIKDKIAEGKDHAVEVFHKATFGLATAFATEAAVGLEADLGTQGDREMVDHRQRVDAYVNRFEKKSLQKAEKMAADIKLPMPGKDLRAILTKKLGSVEKALGGLFVKYGTANEGFKNKLQGITAQATQKNSDLHNTILQEAQASVLKGYETQMGTSVTAKHPQSPSSMKTLHAAALKQALAAWGKLTTSSHSESQFKQYAGNLKSMLATAEKVEHKKNEGHIAKHCEKVAQAEIKVVKRALRSQEHRLPVDEEQVLEIIQQSKATAYKNFEGACSEFSATQAYREARKEMNDKITSAAENFSKRNVEITKERVVRPLKQAKKICKVMVQSYWLTFTFIKDARQVAREEIGKKIAPALREKVIESWLYDEMRDVRPPSAWEYAAFTVLIGAIVMGIVVFAQAKCCGSKTKSKYPTVRPTRR